MPDRPVNAALMQLREIIDHLRCHQLPDEQLLQLFLDQRDEDAFAALVKRHRAMVLGVCQSVLRHVQDAEDVCQATFLVLTRKAASIRNKGAVASWLHGVAYRLARKLEASRAKAGPEHIAPRSPINPLDELSWREVRQIIHEEIERLPQTYRLPVILCTLEGQTQDEAANRLGWTAATLKGRLDRGREMLRRRLTAPRSGLGSAAAGHAPGTGCFVRRRCGHHRPRRAGVQVGSGTCHGPFRPCLCSGPGGIEGYADGQGDAGDCRGDDNWGTGWRRRLGHVPGGGCETCCGRWEG